ncbi:hypothetical protein [Nocardioides alcanivorans]|uniref:hypothetical protein n=1 Tax=Nocardioides alcanivorans TaxID=2897352 RepID=UPI001F3E6223|nr:hypothetical protein [Nocardioides alcanivorans]
MTARTGTDAIAWGRAQIRHPTRGWYRWCLVYVRSAFGVPARWPDAGKAWDNAQRRHKTANAASIPAGVPVFWELPSVADHVALSTGGGMCLSNDIRRKGLIDEVPIDEITRRWGGQLLGWTEDLNGHTVYQPTTTPTTPKDWFDMATKEDLRDVIGTELDKRFEKEKARDAREKARDKKRHQKVMAALKGAPAATAAAVEAALADEA